MASSPNPQLTESPSTKKRRPKGSYSIRRRGRRYQIQTSLQVDGVRKRRCFTGDSPSEVIAMVRDAIAAGKGKPVPRTPGTVGELVKRYLEQYVQSGCAPTTYSLRETLWYGRGKGEKSRSAEQLLGSQPLSKLTTTRVETFYDELRKCGRTATTIHDIGMLMRLAISNRQRVKQYHGDNPFSIVALPKAGTGERRSLNLEEAGAFEAAACGDTYEALWLLLLYTGLRLGEALGLEWSAIDFEHESLFVRQALNEVKGKFILREPKTKKSKRPVPLPSIVLEALKTHQTSTKASSKCFVFSDENGQHPTRSKLRKQFFQPLCERAGISNFTIHGLRHTFASLAVVLKKESMVLVATTLGQSSTRMLSERYTHVIEGSERRAIKAVEELMTEQRKKKTETLREQG